MLQPMPMADIVCRYAVPMVMMSTALTTTEPADKEWTQRDVIRTWVHVGIFFGFE